MKFQGRLLIAVLLSLIALRAPYAAEVGGKPEKVDVIVTYAQPSGAFTPIWVAHEAGPGLLDRPELSARPPGATGLGTRLIRCPAGVHFVRTGFARR